MIRYVLTPDAQRDLEEIVSHLEADSGSRIAKCVATAIVSAFRSLAKSPGIGHKRTDLTARQQLRFWRVFSYLIVYRIDMKPIMIIGVKYGHRDVEQLLAGRS